MTRHVTGSATFWTAVSWLALLAAGAGALFGLVYVDIPLGAMVVLASAAVLLLVLARAPTYGVAFVLVVIVMFLNVASYTFLTFSAEGYQRSTAAGNLLSLIRLPFAGVLVLVVLVRHSRRYSRFLLRNWDVLLLGGVGFLSIFFSLDPVDTIVYTGWFATSLLGVIAFVYALGTMVPPERWSEHLAWLGMLAYTVLVVFGLMNLGDYQAVGLGSLTPAFARSNVHAIACAIVLVSLLVLMRQRRIGVASGVLRRLPPLFLVALGGLAVVPLVLSAKRMPILASLIALAAFLVSEHRLGRSVRKKSVISALLVVGVFVTLAWLVLPIASSTSYRFTRLFETGAQDSSVAARLDILRLGMLIFARSPVFGIGLNNAAAATENLATGGGVAGFSLHNTYAAILVELGSLGMLAFLIVAFRSLWLMRPRRVGPVLSSNLLILGLPAVLYSVTEYSLIPGQIVFWPFWMAVLLPRIVLLPRPADAVPRETVDRSGEW